MLRRALLLGIALTLLPACGSSSEGGGGTDPTHDAATHDATLRGVDWARRGSNESMRTRTGDAAPLLEVEEDGRSEDGQCKHHRPSISTSSWTRTAGLAVGAVLLILALRAAHEEARRCVRP